LESDPFRLSCTGLTRAPRSAAHRALRSSQRTTAKADSRIGRVTVGVARGLAPAAREAPVGPSSRLIMKVGPMRRACRERAPGRSRAAASRPRPRAPGMRPFARASVRQSPTFSRARENPGPEREISRLRGRPRGAFCTVTGVTEGSSASASFTLANRSPYGAAFWRK
jgi:hypothetical protein